MMQNSAKQVEGMVRQKMEQKEYILLCLEDTNDWSNATTRRLVMQVHRLTPWYGGLRKWKSIRCLVMQLHRDQAAAGSGKAKRLTLCAAFGADFLGAWGWLWQGFCRNMTNEHSILWPGGADLQQTT